MSYQMTGKRVMIQPEALPEQIGGVVLPEAVEEFRYSYGKVLAVNAESELKVGQRVVFDQHAPKRVTLPTVGEVRVISEGDVKGVVATQNGEDGIQPTESRVFFTPLVETSVMGIDLPPGAKYNPLLRAQVLAARSQYGLEAGDIIYVDERLAVEIRTRDHGDFWAVHEDYVVAKGS